MQLYEWLAATDPLLLDLERLSAAMRRGSVLRVRSGFRGGVEAMTVQAEIVDESLSSAVGFAEISVAYDLSVWPVMESVSSEVTVHLTGGIKYREGMEAYSMLDAPLAASFSAGTGTVVYTTWRNQSNHKTKMVELLMELYNL